MRKLKYSVLLVALFALTLSVNAQQETTISNYWSHMNVINPAYVGSDGMTNWKSTIRSQWTGISDAPETQLFSFSTPVGKKVGLGMSIVNDEVFIENRRQKPITKKNLGDWLDMSRCPEDFCDANMLKRWKRNEALVDLTLVPEDIRTKILEKFENEPEGDMKKVFNYFIKNRMMMLMEEIDGFKESKYKTYHEEDVMRTA